MVIITIMSQGPGKLKAKDLQILRILQADCRLTAREIAERLDVPITTVFAKIKRFERAGFIKSYTAVLDAPRLNAGTTAFILASFAYRTLTERPLSQREVVAQVAKFAEVQEAHIISGDWDILIKIKTSSVEAVGKFVIDKLRLIKGIEKTLTCLVFESQKESTAIPI